MDVTPLSPVLGANWDNRRVLHRRDTFPDHLRRLMKRCQVLAREA